MTYIKIRVYTDGPYSKFPKIIVEMLLHYLDVKKKKTFETKIN